jgi:hypothetical protein
MAVTAANSRGGLPTKYSRYSIFVISRPFMAPGSAGLVTNPGGRSPIPGGTGSTFVHQNRRSQARVRQTFVVYFDSGCAKPVEIRREPSSELQHRWAAQFPSAVTSSLRRAPPRPRPSPCWKVAERNMPTRATIGLRGSLQIPQTHFCCLAIRTVWARYQASPFALFRATSRPSGNFW